MKKFCLICFTVMLLLLAPRSSAAECGAIQVNAIDHGWYDATGFHDPSNRNYFCGNLTEASQAHRNWFALPIPAAIQQIQSATLRVFTFQLLSADASETFELRHVATPVETVRMGGFGLTNIHADLGDGIVYGSYTIGSGQDDQFIDIPLNSAALANIQAAAGSTMIIGGQITSLDGIPGTQEYAFGNSDMTIYGLPAVHLLLQYVATGPIAFVQQPAGTNVNYGGSISLQAQACGADPMWRQWQRHGTNIPGANSGVLNLSNVTTNDAGPYQMIASNSFGFATSAVAQVTVNYAAPSGFIYFASGSSNAPAGSTVTLCSIISALPAPNYQWLFNGAELAGASGSCLNLPNISSNQAGVYRLRASNAFGIFTSAPMAIAVGYAVPSGIIYLASGPNPAPAANNVTFCSSISAAPAPTLQWQLNGTNLVGQTGNCLVRPNVSSNDAGPYRLVASNSQGSFTSAPITLTVTYAAPTSSVYLAAGQSPAPAGSSVMLCATRSGAPFPSGQWQFNGDNIPGQTGNCLSLSDVQAANEGFYRYVVSNIVGVSTSAPFALSVYYQAPTGSIYFSVGQSPAPVDGFISICSDAFGAPFPSRHWQFNGTNLPVNGTNMFGPTCLNLANLSTNQAGLYRLVLSNSFGMFTSASLTLNVTYIPPTATLSQSGVLPPILEGTTLNLCSTVSGAPTPSRQWLYNGQPIAQFGTCLQIPNVQSNQSGSYSLVASNIAGVVTSAVAIVSVIHAPPTADIYLANGQVPAFTGHYLTLCSSVSGAPFPTRQWTLQGTNLPGQTNVCLDFPNIQPHHAGDYALIASNALGVVTSIVQSISVVEPSTVRIYFTYGAPPFPIGSSRSLCSTVSLPFPFTRQWRFNGMDLPGETNACLYFPSLESSHDGSYSLVATDSSGSYTSAPALLTTYLAPPRGGNPAFYVGSSSMLVGGDLTLYASFSGSPSWIQWRFDGVDLPGQTNYYLVMPSIATNQAGNYSFTATNLAGGTTSSVVTVYVNYQAPSLVFGPTSAAVVAGSNARFGVYAQGGPPPVYFLQQNGTNVAVPFTYEGCCGEYAGGFTLLDVSPADAGQYTIIASNFLGTVSTAPATLTVFPAGPLDRWTQRNPLPQSQMLFDVTRGVNHFVAVGDRGTIITSDDGSNWALQNRRVDLPLTGVAYGNGTYVAVGEGGTILSSGDGTNWAYRYSAPQTWLNDITYGNGLFVAVGSGAGATIFMTSSNGVDWQRVPVPGQFAYQSVAYGNGLFVAGGPDAILTSPNGSNWTKVFTPFRNVESIAYGGGMFVAVGGEGMIVVSSTGTGWQTRFPMTTRRLLGVAYGAGQFVVAGTRGTLLTSPDTLIWTPVSGGTFDRLEALTFGNGLFVSAGENGSIIISTNGNEWTQQNIGITRDLDGMDIANGTIVVVGKGGSILTSTDGTHYTIQNATVTNDLHGVAYGGGLWVAMGEPGIILTSPDAVNWTLRATGTTNSLKGGTYGNGRWVAVGTEGCVVTSTNGVNWSSTNLYPYVGIPCCTYDLNDVAYGHGQFVIAGDGPGGQNGSIYQSANGVTWNLVPFNPGKNLRGILFTNGLFVLPANDGWVFRAGANLSFQASYIGTFPNQRGITFADGLWMIVGNSGTIHTSPDLITFTRRASRTFENFHRVGFFNGRFVTIGNRGTVLQSGRTQTEFGAARFESGIGFSFALNGVLGRVYSIESSTNLVHWDNVSTFTNEMEESYFIDTNSLLRPQQFYRVTEQ